MNELNEPWLIYDNWEHVYLTMSINERAKLDSPSRYNFLMPLKDEYLGLADFINEHSISTEQKDVKIHETVISMEDLFNLPKPTTEEMGWSPKSNPTIAVLCKDEDDVERMCKLYNDKGNNSFVYAIDNCNLYGQNCIAILISKNFENEKLLDNTKWRVFNRCGGHADFKNVFVAKEENNA